MGGAIPGLGMMPGLLPGAGPPGELGHYYVQGVGYATVRDVLSWKEPSMSPNATYPNATGLPFDGAAALARGFVALVAMLSLEGCCCRCCSYSSGRFRRAGVVGFGRLARRVGHSRCFTCCCCCCC